MHRPAITPVGKGNQHTAQAISETIWPKQLWLARQLFVPPESTRSGKAVGVEESAINRAIASRWCKTVRFPGLWTEATPT